jgi:ABC-type dipeptide/oligopeptide/nickel transport system ATPase component
MQNDALIQIEDLKIGFPTADGGWEQVIDGVNLTVGAGERVALVGESGSGKSLTALACLGLVPEPGRVTGGSIQVTGKNIMSMSKTELAELRGRQIGLILQEAVEALNPVYDIGFQVTESISVHRKLGKKDASREALALLSDAALERPEEIVRCYPHELSGGQAQRVMIAIALAGRPRLLIADEPTSALDTLTQAQVIELLDRLVRHGDMGLLLISHDLSVVENTVDRVAVMSAGHIAEEGSTGDVFSSPRHPSTRELMGLHRRKKTRTHDQEDDHGAE